ncbi:MAG: (2Fe-2S) ferredoxin domain-containing protein [Candidatus Diapherotrites archaeon]|nr:(2Fe-2S) ferredoxin domain-containing protein [Candidatus Diapherotrites archaeon]
MEFDYIGLIWKMNYKKHILVCTNEKPLHCAEKGGLELFQSFKDEVLKQELQNEFLVSKTGCTHQHSCGPVVIIYPGGVWLKEVSKDNVQEIVSSLKDGKLPEKLINPIISVG